MKISRVAAFQVRWDGPAKSAQTSAFVRVETEDGVFGLGEVSPMARGYPSLSLIARELAPEMIGRDVFDHAVLLDTLLHKCIKLGPEGIVSAAIAGLDIALWDLKGKILGQPIYKLLGGAWRTKMSFYASVGNISERSVPDLVRYVQQRVESERPAAVKIRLDGDRARQDVDLAGDIAKVRAVRKALGDDIMLAFDASNGYSIGAAMRMGRVLEELGYAWFEEPVQHYHVAAMGELAQRLDITVSAGEQTYTLQGLKDLINAGVRMVQPDLVKMGGITGLMACAAVAFAHGVELVPHQTQPAVGHMANLHMLSTIMHLTKPAELADRWQRANVVFTNPAGPIEGHYMLSDAPGLGLEFDSDEMQRRSIAVTA